MSDFKHLYLEARKGHSSDISSYVEAVNSALDNDPVGYILGLEYIISSDVGLKTLKTFVEKYGLSVAAYDYVEELLESCIEKCNAQNKDASLYKEAFDYIESFKTKYRGAYDMYSYYNEGFNEDYIRTYYGSTKGNQNRLLLNGMVSKFAERAIPDLIIVANESGRGAATKLENAISSMPEVGDSMFCEWVDTACSGTICSPEVKFNTLSTLVADCRDRHHKVYRESVITGNNDAFLEYTDEDVNAIQNLIHFKEFALTGMDSKNVESIMEAQREIYDLYNELDGVIFESNDNLEEKKDEKLVPIYGLVKCYNVNTADERSVSLKKKLKVMTRGDNYSHAVVSFDDTFKDMYSFESEGIVNDSIDNPNWMTTDSIYLCVMFIPESDSKKMEKYCKNLASHKETTKYGYSNMVKAYIAKPVKKDNRFICSTFVAFILRGSDSKNLHRDYSRMRPEDITILPRAFYIANLKDRNDFIKKKDMIKTKVDEIFKTHKDELEDYNNHLPKLLLKDKMTELKTFDKLLDYFMSRA